MRLPDYTEDLRWTVRRCNTQRPLVSSAPSRRAPEAPLDCAVTRLIAGPTCRDTGSVVFYKGQYPLCSVVGVRRRYTGGLSQSDTPTALRTPASCRNRASGVGMTSWVGLRGDGRPCGGMEARPLLPRTEHAGGVLFEPAPDRYGSISVPSKHESFPACPHCPGRLRHKNLFRPSHSVSSRGAAKNGRQETMS